MDEIKNEGVQTTLVAMHMMGMIPEEHQGLYRLAMGESFVRPIATLGLQPEENVNASGPAQIDAALGITGAAAKATSESVSHEVAAAITRMDCGPEITRVWTGLGRYVSMAVEKIASANGWVRLPMSLAVGLCDTAGSLDLSRNPCGQLNGSFNALSALRKTVRWANQNVYHPNETAVDYDWDWSATNAMEWGYRATLAGTCLAKWRLMRHTMVPLVQCYGGGLEHDCS
ncbi:hypothetical protein AK812_SmicGene43836, partial [Symbiodinium microadriaticum]